MRALQYILISFLVIGFLAVSSFLVAREVLVYWSGKTLERSIGTLRKAQLAGTYSRQCAQKGSTVIDDSQSIVMLQLRFISSTDFVLEGVCQQFSFDPIPIGRGELPPFIEKVPGTSGFIVDDRSSSAVSISVFEDYVDLLTDSTGIDLSFLRRQEHFAFADGDLIDADETLAYDQGPVTTCGGYGFQCCQQASEAGIGERITGLSDCSEQCYAQCIPRPILLSFSTDPLVNPIDRTVKVQSGQQVDFSYLADDARDEHLRATIEFGDGARTEAPHKQGVVTHTYQCPTGSCQYTAHITLYDSWGVASAETSHSKIIVNVQN